MMLTSGAVGKAVGALRSASLAGRTNEDVLKLALSNERSGTPCVELVAKTALFQQVEQLRERVLTRHQMVVILDRHLSYASQRMASDKFLHDRELGTLNVHLEEVDLAADVV